MITQTKETQQALSAQEALQLLKDGNKRFLNNQEIERNLLQQVNYTGHNGQAPYAVVLSCIDSRVPVEKVFDLGIGDIFSARIAGNFVNEDILGSVEFACKLAGSKVILVLGHTKCGAVKGACDGAKLGNLTGMLDKIMPAVDAVAEPSENRNSSNADFVQAVVEKNVELTMENIKTMSPVLNEMIQNGDVLLVGGCYDVETGKVDFN
jgi:carbonic anhydrase